MSEGINDLNQHEGGRSDVLPGGNDRIAGPSLPFPCSKCPNYSEPIIYSRKCYYGPQCGFGVIALTVQRWRLRLHV